MDYKEKEKLKKDTSKIKTKPITIFEGLKIYGCYRPARKRGKDRIWISIRQDSPKKWRTATTLSYVRAVDICFEK